MHMYTLMQEDPNELSDADLLKVLNHIVESSARGVGFNLRYLHKVLTRSAKTVDAVVNKPVTPL